MRLATSERLQSLLLQAELPGPLYEQASAVVAKAMATYQAFPAWPIPELPRRCLVALGAPEAVSEAAAAAAVLFYGASDIIDDAQDGELDQHPFWPGGSWQEAVNTGNLLLFLSGLAIAEADLPPGVAARWHGAFAAAGVRLARGQALDMGAAADAPYDEATVEAVTRDKAGAAWRCLISLGPIWEGAARDRVEAFGAVGERLGMAHQLASDIWPYLLPGPQADLATGKLTLPLFFAREADSGLGGLWRSGPLDAAGQEALRERVLATGAIMYAQMRVEVWKKEAQDALLALEVPSLAAELAGLIDMVTFERAAGPGA